MILPIVLIFAAYGGVTYAAILLKGWNVTANQWFNPLAGFSWANDPLCIPDSQVFPGGPGAACGGKANSHGGCGSFTESELLKILANPAEEAKLAECLSGKGADEIAHIAKDLWHWVTGTAPSPGPAPGRPGGPPGPNQGAR